MSRDPVVASTMAPYAYVAGNPLNATDRTGLSSEVYVPPADTGFDILPPIFPGPLINLPGIFDNGPLINVPAVGGVVSGCSGLGGSGLAGGTGPIFAKVPEGGWATAGAANTPDWPVQTPEHDCLECATDIQGLIGGTIVQLTPSAPGRVLGPSTNNAGGNWVNHYAVGKGGRLHDSYTGPNGMTATDYLGQWSHGDSITIGPGG